MVSELPHGEVTIADLFRALLEIQGSMATMGTEVKVLTTQLAAQGDSAAKAIEGNRNELLDHETRLRGLESVRAKVIGGASVAGVVAGSLGGWLASHIH